jgi:hypothetical protein
VVVAAEVVQAPQAPELSRPLMSMVMRRSQRSASVELVERSLVLWLGRARLRPARLRSAKELASFPEAQPRGLCLQAAFALVDSLVLPLTPAAVWPFQTSSQRCRRWPLRPVCRRRRRRSLPKVDVSRAPL